MDLTGEYRIPAPREAVWQALNDPEVLRACIPGAESLEKLSDTEFQAAVKAKVGPVSARFQGKVTLSDLEPPSRYTISGEGTGGAAGFAKGGADVALAEAGDGGTVLSYRANVQVGGKLAQVGSRLVAGTARKMADEFFGRFAERLGGARAAPAAAEAEAPAAERPAVRPAVWIAILVAAVVVLLLIVGL
jgi:carbon monoxide dehydrogenase subunit G